MIVWKFGPTLRRRTTLRETIYLIWMFFSCNRIQISKWIHFSQCSGQLSTFWGWIFFSNWRDHEREGGGQYYTFMESANRVVWTVPLSAITRRASPTILYVVRSVLRFLSLVQYRVVGEDQRTINFLESCRRGSPYNTPWGKKRKPKNYSTFHIAVTASKICMTLIPFFPKIIHIFKCNVKHESTLRSEDMEGWKYSKEGPKFRFGKTIEVIDWEIIQ